MDNDELLRKKGRAIIAFSFAVLIYHLGGGELNGNLFGGVISFQNKLWLEGGIIVVFFYLVYRYWVGHFDRWRAFREDVLEVLKNDRGKNSFRKFANQQAEKYVHEKIRNNESVHGFKLASTSQSGGRFYFQQGNPIIDKGWRKDKTISIQVLKNGQAQGSPFSITIDSNLYREIYLRKWWRVMHKSDHGWNYMVGLLLSSYAIMVILINIGCRVYY